MLSGKNQLKTNFVVAWFFFRVCEDNKKHANYQRNSDYQLPYFYGNRIFNLQDRFR